MRDFTSRLREIVKRDGARRGSSPVTGHRELTYAPEMSRSHDAAGTAAQLGGTVYTVAGSSCVVIDRIYDAYGWHGRQRVESYATDPAWPIALFDSRLSSASGWASRVVFFDIETTGLSGGAGTLAFLAGCGWFDAGDFHVRQFFLNGPGGEHAMLDALTRIFDAATRPQEICRTSTCCRPREGCGQDDRVRQARRVRQVRQVRRVPNRAILRRSSDHCWGFIG